MRAVDGPPVVDEYVEDAEHDDEERRGPLGFEPYSDHSAGRETDQRYEDTSDAPFATEREADEQEDKQNTAC